MLTLRIVNADEEEFDTKVVTIDAWWDRFSRNWVIQLKNKDGFQVGDAFFAGNRKDKDACVKTLKEEYNI